MERVRYTISLNGPGAWNEVVSECSSIREVVSELKRLEYMKRITVDQVAEMVDWMYEGFPDSCWYRKCTNDQRYTFVVRCI